MTSPDEAEPAGIECPHWCLGLHRAGLAHISAEARIGDLLLELIRYPEDERVYLSMLERTEGGRFLVVPMSVVPLIATVALRLAAPVAVSALELASPMGRRADLAGPSASGEQGSTRPPEQPFDPGRS